MTTRKKDEPMGKAKRQRTSEESEDTSLEAQLECPICLKYPMMPPIRQCSNGHLLCDACSRKPQCRACPQCRSHPTNIRCLALEKAVGGLTLRCTHAELGCKMKIPYSEVAQHGSNCRYGPFKCIHCAEILKLPTVKVMEHFVGKHGIQVIKSKKFRAVDDMICSIQLEYKQNDFVNAHGWQDRIVQTHDESRSFLVRLLCQDDFYRFELFHLGVDEHCYPYLYELTLQGGSHKMCIQTYARQMRTMRNETSHHNQVISKRIANFAMKARGCEQDLVMGLSIRRA
eukprot:gnl/MRDRNA2_/MRDRNA2_144111_c0_seq1.p1 gnl/MRDRNA2_/MRDRNA2_144111_c0~~gnl/MRDRNA2_/MRDRNA2_144111_c0_seq1.p1  ORF type:complete len:285 (+),score=24.39 gnl/MRDRNA2_/MRDRNA2_144111_c0_seq1:113-967(+)